jgi:hypothetical protein
VSGHCAAAEFSVLMAIVGEGLMLDGLLHKHLRKTMRHRRQDTQ